MSAASIFALGAGAAHEAVRKPLPATPPATPAGPPPTSVSIPVFHGNSVRVTIPTGSLTYLPSGTEPLPHMKVIRVLTPEHGDERFAWDPSNEAQVEDARAFFLNCIAQGLIPHYVGEGDAADRPMAEFDEAAGRFVATPITSEPAASREAVVAPTRMLAGG